MTDTEVTPVSNPSPTQPKLAGGSAERLATFKCICCIAGIGMLSQMQVLMAVGTSQTPQHRRRPLPRQPGVCRAALDDSEDALPERYVPQPSAGEVSGFRSP